MNLCECGCGRQTGIAPITVPKRGYVKGQPLRFVRGHHAHGGKTVYRKVKRPGGKRGDSIALHTAIAERVLGRRLRQGTEVHHVDENKRNNAHGNLVICESREYHQFLHARTKVVRNGGDPNAERFCARCQQCWPVDDFYLRHTGKRLSRCNYCCSHPLESSEVCRAKRAAEKTAHTA